MSAEDRLWFVLDMDEGVVAVGRTRREAMSVAGIPTKAQWKGCGTWKRYRYTGSGEEIVWGYRDDDPSLTDLFIEHGLESLHYAGWGEALEDWRAKGSPVGVRVPTLGRPTTDRCATCGGYLTDGGAGMTELDHLICVRCGDEWPISGLEDPAS